MAILITVYQCDNCPNIVSIKTDDDWRTFEQVWWEGIQYQFCPVCRKLAETQSRRISDARIFVIPAHDEPTEILTETIH